jgi:hypothetical protein
MNMPVRSGVVTALLLLAAKWRCYVSPRHLIACMTGKTTGVRVKAANGFPWFETVAFLVILLLAVGVEFGFP